MRRALFALGLFGAGLGFVACGADDSAHPNAIPTTTIPSGSPDATVPIGGEDGGEDAGELLQACDPSTPTSCPNGFTCYPTHTSTMWWVDLYGKCTFGCTSLSLALCASMDGVCGCPVGVDGTSHCGLPDGGTNVSGDASLSTGVDSGKGAAADAAASDGAAEGGSVEEEDAGPELPQPITADSLVCVPAVRPGSADGG